ncbi:MAG: iron response transcriptional regulator IrrA [Pseudomonadota bacterium]
MTPSDRGIEWLNSADVRVTRQRVALAELLVGDGGNRHVCAEDLHAQVNSDEASVSLATVYNTLRAFCAAGLLREVRVDGQKSYFDTRLDDHPHYFFEDTGALCDAPADAVTVVDVKDAPAGMEIAKVDILIRVRAKA